METVSDSELKL